MGKTMYVGGHVIFCCEPKIALKMQSKKEKMNEGGGGGDNNGEEKKSEELKLPFTHRPEVRKGEMFCYIQLWLLLYNLILETY